MPTRPEDLQATYCATLVDEWVRDGVEHAVVCPGSRSTPLALALVADDRVRVHVHHDERSGGFMALGLGAATGEAVVVLTTTDDKVEIDRCYDMGANVYITKPVNYESFSDAIRQLGLFLAVIQVPEGEAG